MSDNPKQAGGDAPPSRIDLSEGARGGMILPIQAAPADITNQVGGIPLAGHGPANTAPASPSGSSADQE